MTDLQKSGTYEVGSSFMEAHGGRLWASPAHPYGTAFYFSLPRGEDARAVTDLTPVVLVIDDDISVREALRDLFESVGPRVTLFESARQFLRTKRTETSDCRSCS